MPLPNRVLEKLDDGRVVYRPSFWTAPVLLSQSDYATVEGSLGRRLASGMLLGLVVFVPYLLYRNHIISSATALFLVLGVVSLAFTAEYFLGRGAKAILKNAPVAPNYADQKSVSKLDVLRSLPGLMIEVLDDKGIRAGLFLAGTTLLSSVYGLVRTILGAPLSPDLSVFLLILMAILSGLGFRSLARERKRRKIARAGP